MGRLIDADELKKDYPHDSDWEYPVNTNEYVCESIDNAPTVEVIPKAEYENRLKADLVAMLESLNLEIDEMFARRIDYTVDKIQDLIQQKIDLLKEAKDGENNN